MTAADLKQLLAELETARHAAAEAERLRLEAVAGERRALAAFGESERLLAQSRKETEAAYREQRRLRELVTNYEALVDREDS